MITHKIKRLEKDNILSPQESEIAKYIESNPESILNLSTYELADASYVSVSTIIRFCQKIGFKGYREFKTQYSLEYKEYMKVRNKLNDLPFNQNSTLKDVMNTVPLIYYKTVEDTQTYLNYSMVEWCVNEIKKSDIVILYGDGINYHIAKSAAHRMNSLGGNAVAYNSFHGQQVRFRLEMGQRVFSIVVSHHGDNVNMVNIVNRLNTLDMKYVLVTRMGNNALSRLSSKRLEVMITQKSLELSDLVFSLSSGYILEILVVMTLIQNYEVLDKIQKQRDNEREIRKQYEKDQDSYDWRRE
ncbi:MurR/RpiR family transcriptional regulator [Erysipelothrix sp. HDW6A]|uniref:MurR/RpiR family transcriptional regulator n=1 Tax=Erysipelothrix sp. HDW6A TaxID=2714928 RepID=UPI0014090F5C|nr:MurR/RpiR family transcriptional regulator [Erysipelothrix sp. HDW6A]QIK57070.1 MurR/RpiR family transcriptional regulator [Erysipelothrix sp. HDW6A]